MTWLQELAWKEAFTLLSRSPGQHKKMGFASLADATAFELRRVSALGEEPK